MTDIVWCSIWWSLIDMYMMQYMGLLQTFHNSTWKYETRHDTLCGPICNGSSLQGPGNFEVIHCNWSILIKADYYAILQALMKDWEIIILEHEQWKRKYSIRTKTTSVDEHIIHEHIILNKHHQPFLRKMLQHLNIALFLCTTLDIGLASLPSTQMDMSEQQKKSQCQFLMKYASAIGCRQLELHPLQQLITTRTEC